MFHAIYVRFKHPWILVSLVGSWNQSPMDTEGQLSFGRESKVKHEFFTVSGFGCIVQGSTVYQVVFTPV